VAKLIISREGEETRTVPLAKGRVSLGRRRHNDIVLAHPAVSGEHAVIVTILDDSYLEDLASTNGSFVNGHRVNKHFLRDQDLITLAKYQLKYVSDGVPPFSAAAAAPMIATIRVVSGANAGKQLTLSKPLTTLGRAGVQVVAIRRAADAYYIEQTEGEHPALLNDGAIGRAPRALAHGDLIELTGTKMVFGLEMQAAG
jgi:pSer/pThr/pTyr-binding forkhead associated (FHA) protein